jgi:hypothetical protein
MSLSPIGKQPENYETYQISVDKKKDYFFFRSYELKVTIKDKTVNIKMNTFRTPWSEKIIGKDLFKKILNEFNLKEGEQVNSLMKAFIHLNLALEKKIQSEPLPQEIKTLKQKVNVSTACLKLFYEQYPQSHEIAIQPSEFKGLLTDSNQVVDVVKKQITLLYHELIQEEPKEEILKQLAQKISDQLEEVKKNPKTEEVVKEALLKSFKFLKSVIVEREKLLKELITLEQSIGVKGDGIGEEAYQNLLASLEEETDQDLLKGTEGLSFSQFKGFVQAVHQKREALMKEYEEMNQEILSFQKKAYSIVDQNQQKKAANLAEEREEKKRDSLIKFEQDLNQLNELRRTGVINQVPISQVDEEISSLNESLGFLYEQINELNRQLDDKIAVQDSRPSFRQIFSSLLEEKGEGQEIKELIHDMGSLASYPFQSAWVKISKLKAKNEPGAQELIQKLKTLEKQVQELNRKKEPLAEKRELFKTQIQEMRDRIEWEYEEALRAADQEYEQGIQLSMKEASLEYKNSITFLERPMKKLEESYLKLKPLFETSRRLNQLFKEHETTEKRLNQQTKLIEGEIQVDFRSLSDQKSPPLAPLELVTLCSLATLGFE